MSSTVDISQETKNILSQWYDRRTLDDTSVVRGSLFGAIFGMSGQHAVTINRRVHLTKHAKEVDSPLGIMLLGHELFHVVHQQELGWWKYLLCYLTGWRPSHVSNGRTHPMERPPYERGDEIWRAMLVTN